MKIKEVEQILNIPKATIRFYEKEGLLTPERNSNSYREYSEADVNRLKKIIVLRKVGVSVEAIKSLLDDTASLQEVLTKNISDLHSQMKEIEGALKVCAMMQEKEENLLSLDEEYYWEVIHKEEQNGNKFFEILNDVIEFEKKVIWDEFGLADEQGNLRFSLGKSVAIAIGMCVAAGLLWYFLDGRNPDAFVEGFFFPFVCIIITSVFGLPLYFLEKKNEKAANLIKKIGMGIGVVFLIVVVLMMIFLEV